MKLPVIRHAYQQLSEEQIDHTLEALEILSEARGWKEEELNVIGELITNLCGAIEVRSMVNGGMRESEALNTFAQKVIGSVDK